MAVQQFLARIAGFTEQVMALVTSTGAADAGKIVATDVDGRINPSLMPEGIGANTITATAGVALVAGNFVTLTGVGGVLTAVLADNTAKPADGYVKEGYADQASDVLVYPLDDANSNLTGLTVGDVYWLGTAGGVIDTPLDESDIANKTKYSQQLGIAISATELRTSDYGFVKL